jgi:hypothetical protein
MGILGFKVDENPTGGTVKNQLIKTDSDCGLRKRVRTDVPDDQIGRVL